MRHENSLRHENDCYQVEQLHSFVSVLHYIYIYFCTVPTYAHQKKIFLYSFLFIEKQTISCTYAKKSKRYVLDVFFSLYL